MQADAGTTILIFFLIFGLAALCFGIRNVPELEKNIIEEKQIRSQEKNVRK
jgi:hypothetical protein